jgi:aspartate-semialdehyde dehydrogenase
LAKPAPKTESQKLALVGSATLLGVEIQEVLKARKAGVSIDDYAANAEGNFGEEEGEAVYVQALDASALADCAGVILAGSPDGALKAYRLANAARGRPVLIDCVGDLEAQPEARIVSPLLGGALTDGAWLFVVAHPAASALAVVLTRLARKTPIRQAVANIFEPASERGKRGLSELQQQVVSLLSFKSVPKDVFDAHLGFNLLAAYGEQAPAKLSMIEQRIERHTATLLSRSGSGSAIPMPSLRLVQAPVFHGYSVSVWVEFADEVEAGELGEALASAQIEVRGQEEEAPDNVGVAGQSGLIVGDIRIDRNNPRAAWLWVVADNLRLRADAAADLVSELGAKHP